MHNWVDLLQNALPINAIFGKELPALNNVSVHEIDVKRDGPTVLLRFDLDAFPDCPPVKWKIAGFNRVQVRLLAIGVNELQITGLQPNIYIDIHIVMDGSLIRVQGDNGKFRFDLLTEILVVDGISAYREGGQS